MDRKKSRKFIAPGIIILGVVLLSSVTACLPAAGLDMREVQSEIKHLQHAAHSPDQFTALAGLYKQQHDEYLRLATEQKQEWQRSSQFTGSIEEKYPRPADKSRNLYEYYTYKAMQTGQLSGKYTQLATQEIASKP